MKLCVLSLLLAVTIVSSQRVKRINLSSLNDQIARSRSIGNRYGSTNLVRGGSLRRGSQRAYVDREALQDMDRADQPRLAPYRAGGGVGFDARRYDMIDNGGFGGFDRGFENRISGGYERVYDNRLGGYEGRSERRPSEPRSEVRSRFDRVGDRLSGGYEGRFGGLDSIRSAGYEGRSRFDGLGDQAYVSRRGMSRRGGRGLMGNRRNLPDGEYRTAHGIMIRDGSDVTFESY